MIDLPQVLVDRTQHPPFSHPTPLFSSIYTYQSTDAIRKRHIIAVLHISKPWKWKKKEKKNEKKGGCCVSCPQVPVRFTCNNKSILKSTLLFFGINAI